jgi:hypothetical protein
MALDTTYVMHTSQLKSDTIPDSVFLMIHLKHLVIQGSDCDYVPHPNCWAIKEIPKKIGQLKKLESLHLNVNAIHRLPQEMSELQQLKSLDLTDNLGLHDINVVTTLTNLEELTMYGCGLSKLPLEIGKLKKLKYLGLTGNPIDKSEFGRIKKALPNCEVSFRP